MSCQRRRTPETITIRVQRFSVLLLTELQGEEEFHRATDEALCRGPRRMSGGPEEESRKSLELKRA